MLSCYYELESVYPNRPEYYCRENCIDGWHSILDVPCTRIWAEEGSKIFYLKNTEYGTDQYNWPPVDLSEFTWVKIVAQRI